MPKMTINFLLLIIFLLILPVEIPASPGGVHKNKLKKIHSFYLHNTKKTQDSLRLAKILAGIDSAHRIIDASGAGDINGDGYYDLVVSYRTDLWTFDYTDYAELYPGNPFFELTNKYKINCSLIVPVGDINDDGYDDLLIGKHYIFCGEQNELFFYILYGGEVIDTIPKFFFQTPCNLTDPEYICSVDRLGDVNGDGYDDLAFTIADSWTLHASVYIFFGGREISNQPGIILTSPYQYDFFGNSVSGIGDINVDGYDDFLVGAPYGNIGDSSKVYLFLGRDTLSTTPERVLRNPSASQGFGDQIHRLSNFYGNTKNEFIISTRGANSYVYFNLDSIAALPNLDNTSGDLYIALGKSGDINGDGFDDIVTGNEYYGNRNRIAVGEINVYFGGSDFNPNPAILLEGNLLLGQFGRYVNIIGDFNGYGYDDVIVGEPEENLSGYYGKLYIYSYPEITGVDKENNKPEEFNILQNYPNPFNPSTTILLNLQKKSDVEIIICDVLGRNVTVLTGNNLSPGEHSIVWNGTNIKGEQVPSGIYFYRMNCISPDGKTASQTKVNKMVLLR